VLTSFAGIDIGFGEGPPAFFETRVLDGYDELECLESLSWNEARARHAAATERLGQGSPGCNKAGIRQARDVMGAYTNGAAWARAMDARAWPSSHSTNGSSDSEGRSCIYRRIRLR